jgi:hypothetical protein
MENDRTQSLNPYADFSIEEDLPYQIILKNGYSKAKYSIFIIMMIELANTIIHPSLFQYIILLFFILSLIVFFIVGDPDELMVTTNGITFTRSIFGITHKHFLPSVEIKSIKYASKRTIWSKLGWHSGYIEIHCSDGRTYNIIRIWRKIKNQLVADLNIIASRLSQILSITN